MSSTAHEDQFITHPDDLPADQPTGIYDLGAAFNAAPQASADMTTGQYNRVYDKAMEDAAEIADFFGCGKAGSRIRALKSAPAAAECWCHTCRPITLADMRMVLCPDCGNKRCPHANDHRNACTGSNDPGQLGSAYPAAEDTAKGAGDVTKAASELLERWDEYLGSDYQTQEDAYYKLAKYGRSSWEKLRVALSAQEQEK